MIEVSNARARRNRDGRAAELTRPNHPALMDPNELRARLRSSLAQMSEEERDTVREAVVSVFKRRGVNLSCVILLLGINATCEEDLTPSDIGHLVRYARIVLPEVINELAPAISALLNRPDLLKQAA